MSTTTIDPVPDLEASPASGAAGGKNAFEITARNVAGVPTAIDASAGLGAQTLPEGWADSIYVSGHLHAGGRHFAYLVHVLVMGAVAQQTLNVTDVDAGTTEIYEQFVPADRFRWADSRLNIRTPQLQWTGDLDRQEISATAPWGSLDITLESESAVLFYAGTGTFNLLGNPQYQYALPQLRTVGTLVVNGETQRVTGRGWLDRQIGQFPNPANQRPGASPYRWTWMDLPMPGGDKVAIWDIGYVDGADGTDEAWATVLHPDGRHELVPVTPLRKGVRRRWTSPRTGVTWVTEWAVSIPALQADLVVTVSPDDQEIVSVGGDGISGADRRYQGPATFRGTYRGSEVSGETYPEQVGAWSA